MSRVLMTSTMKSEPGTPPMRAPAKSFGVPLSAAATCILGGNAEGGRGAALVVAVVAACAGGTALATATPARNLRRLTCGRGCFRAMAFLPRWSCAAGPAVTPAESSCLGQYYRRGETRGRRPTAQLLHSLA